MRKGVRLGLFPAIVAFSAFFLVVPRGGQATTVRIVTAGDSWRFAPSSATVPAGERIAFVNDTTVTHTATCDECGWDTGDIQPGQTKFVTVTGTRVGTYVCTYHGQSPGMTGEVALR